MLKLLVRITATRLLIGLIPVYLPCFFLNEQPTLKEKSYISEQDTSLGISVYVTGGAKQCSAAIHRASRCEADPYVSLQKCVKQ
jgi:hypothetical protein